MRRCLLVALAACSASHKQVPLVTVKVFAGNAEAVGATVIAHDADGAPLDSVQADPTGTAEVAAPDGAYVTAVFPAAFDANTQALTFVTAPAPQDGGELDVYGPPEDTTATVAGVLEVAPQQALAADHFEIQLGCTTTQVTTMPASIDVSSRCLGSDEDIDVLVLGTQGGQLAGYTAARLDLSEGAATLAPATWSTTAPGVPIALTGVAPALDWVLYADGLPFGAQPISGTAPLWTGLAVDSADVHATLGAAPSTQTTTLFYAGAPTSIAVSASDFLPPIAPSLALGASTAPALTWTPAGVAADAIHLHLAWTSAGRTVTWDAVLPPDAAAAALPQVGGDLGAIALPADATPDAHLSYLQLGDGAGFDALVAGGLHFEASPPAILARPAMGELRTTEADGYAP